MSVKLEKSVTEVFLEEFIFVESEDVDQLLVARLLKLYENGKFSFLFLQLSPFALCGNFNNFNMILLPKQMLINM